MSVDCHPLDTICSAELSVSHTHTHWTSLTFFNIWAFLGSLLSPPLSVSPYFCSLFFLVPPCSLIKTRLGSRLMESAGEQRRRCSSSWNCSTFLLLLLHVIRTSSLSPFYQLWWFCSSLSAFSPDSALRTLHSNFVFNICCCCNITDYHLYHLFSLSSVISVTCRLQSCWTETVYQLLPSGSVEFNRL